MIDYNKLGIYPITIGSNGETIKIPLDNLLIISNSIKAFIVSSAMDRLNDEGIYIKKDLYPGNDYLEAKKRLYDKKRDELDPYLYKIMTNDYDFNNHIFDPAILGPEHYIKSTKGRFIVEDFELIFSLQPLIDTFKDIRLIEILRNDLNNSAEKVEFFELIKLTDNKKDKIEKYIKAIAHKTTTKQWAMIYYILFYESLLTDYNAALFWRLKNISFSIDAKDPNNGYRGFKSAIDKVEDQQKSNEPNHDKYKYQFVSLQESLGLI